MRWRAAVVLMPWLALVAPMRVEVKVFEHKNHVPSAWYRGSVVRDGVEANPEMLRDCRGCHVYEKGKPPVDPQKKCGTCHDRVKEPTSKLAIIAAPPFGQDLSALRDAGSAVFEHGDHLRLQCRECHLLPQGGLEDPLPIVAGATSCESCHSDQQKNRVYQQVVAVPGAIDRSSLSNAGFAAVLNKHPQMQPGQLGKFRHQDHLLNPKAMVTLAALLAEKGECMACHAKVKDVAGRAIGAERFTVKACATCHVNAAGKAVAFALEKVAGASRAAGTFRHADHVRAAKKPTVCSDDARKRVDERGCGACHGLTQGADGLDAWSMTLPDGAEASSYEGCVACHTPKEWQTSYHGGTWDKCVGCHAFGGASLKETRPMSEVTRRDAMSVDIVVQAHPYITGDELAGDAAKDCAACHKASVKALPSRIQRKVFNHKTHLPPQPTPADCKKCHPAVATSTSADTLAAAVAAAANDAPSDRTYTLSACSECHRGAVLTVREGDEPTKRAVPRFAHKDHVDKKRGNGDLMACATCHQTGDGGVTFSIPDTKSCAECHGHDDKRRADTKNIGGTDVTSCALCHGESVPAAGGTVADAKLTLRGADTAQFHGPAEAKCDRCHVAPEKPWQLIDHVKAEVLIGLLHKDGADRQDGANCYGCHWNRQQNAQPGDFAQKRAQLGNLKDGYPGRSAPDPR